MGYPNGSIEWACDRWARQTAESGGSKLRQVDYHGNATGGHRAVFWEGPKLYSHGYHYLLGELFQHRGRTWGAINCEPYGGYAGRRELKDTPSTQNHRRIAAQALRQADVPYVDAYLPLDPASEVIRYLEQAQASVAKANKVRSAQRAAWSLEAGANHIRSARDVAELFDLPRPSPVALPPTTREELRGFAVRRLLHGDGALRDALNEFEWIAA